MTKMGKLGWVIAGALLVGWLGADKDETTVTSPHSIEAPVDPPSVEKKASENAAVPTTVDPSTVIQARPGAEEELQPPTVLYTTANVRLRAGPSTSAGIVRTVPARTEIRSRRQEGDWHQVRLGRDEGWIRRDLLSSILPSLPKNQMPIATKTAPLTRQTPDRQAGQPVRDPFVGTCDCPYDLMRNGRRCGGRSAYSRPGGRRPICYY